MDAAAVTTLIDEATKKSGLIWVKAADSVDPAQAVWHVWQDGSAWILGGGAEQQLPALDSRCHVTVRSKDKGARLLTWVADAHRVEPESEEWQSVLPTLLSKRLNLQDGDAAAARWTSECTLWRLTPTGETTETPDAPSTASHAAEPPPSSARSRVPRPLHLLGRRRRRTPDLAG
jgi:hypothetical protein